ncbi:MAG: SsrA-binding protein [Candidatus Liptonbacteria bacterium RIFOXYB1_FULL_36_10]|uniref:SsrA-binding protein n=2 Tax=Candidatus Liptoniibacteriota TaxID=1817909 RepID=A0A1G2CNZ7_9BACT|nr:MAG: SsrA-binding protein [Candidatus Liptonbacteria bacterium RIFOXYB1_FULL_36_10]OGZ03296.1 MAG: SsrA-binding protein [Candidatus Liptonbacteria bacterium RIFOXYD1_FULL_36_11]
MTLAENKKARFDYEILEKIEAGIELKGGEVKAVKSGKMSLTGTYAVFRGGEMYLIGCDIAPYQPLNLTEEYDSKRSRRLLLHRSEMAELSLKVKERGLTLVPLSVYDRAGLVKVLLGLAKRKKKFDKREKIRERDEKRKIEVRLKKLED